MSDTVRRFLFDGLDIRGAVARLDTVWQKLMAGRGYPAPVIDLLGQMSVTAVLLADNLKQARLTLQMRGSGPISRMVVDCGEHLNLRCMAHYDDGIAAAPVAKLLGDGQLMLTLDTPEHSGLYQSLVPIEGGTVAEIFEHYLQRSEQRASRLFLATTPTRAAGLYIQKMPADDLHDPDGWARVSTLAATVKPEELTGLSDEELLTRLFHEENVRLFDAHAVSSNFEPDTGKMGNILLALGREEVYENLDRNGLVIIHDELSNHEYRFTREEIDALFIRSPETPKSVH